MLTQPLGALQVTGNGHSRIIFNLLTCAVLSEGFKCGGF
jgi:hypothetical protein